MFCVGRYLDVCNKQGLKEDWVVSHPSPEGGGNAPESCLQTLKKSGGIRERERITCTICVCATLNFEVSDNLLSTDIIRYSGDGFEHLKGSPQTFLFLSGWTLDANIGLLISVC